MKFLYWNTHKLEKIDRIIDITQQELPEFFFLSEIDKEILEHNFDEFNNIGYEYYPNPGCERVSIIKKIDLEANLELQNKYYTTVKISKCDLYIISIHLPSQMFQHMDGLKEFIRDFRTNIDSEIGTSLEKKVLIIGDFNVNPYEKPMIDFDGFLATNSINSRKIISHLGKSRTSYYNPTWQLYNRKKFPGTKYFPRPSSSSYDIIEYHFLDQVVISQGLLDKIIEQKIEIIENSQHFRFYCEEKNSTEGSDHLPLSYQFSLQT